VLPSIASGQAMAGVAAVEARLHLISKNDGTKVVKNHFAGKGMTAFQFVAGLE